MKLPLKKVQNIIRIYLLFIITFIPCILLVNNLLLTLAYVKALDIIYRDLNSKKKYIGTNIYLILFY